MLIWSLQYVHGPAIRTQAYVLRPAIRTQACHTYTGLPNVHKPAIRTRTKARHTHTSRPYAHKLTIRTQADHTHTSLQHAQKPTIRTQAYNTHTSLHYAHKPTLRTQADHTYTGRGSGRLWSGQGRCHAPGPCSGWRGSVAWETPGASPTGTLSTSPPRSSPSTQNHSLLMSVVTIIITQG